MENFSNEVEGQRADYEGLQAAEGEAVHPQDCFVSPTLPLDYIGRAAINTCKDKQLATESQSIREYGR